MEKMTGTVTTELISVEPSVDHIVVKDRISELPWEILDNILGRVPIKNAVATTILSRKWKDKWVDVSKIVLDNKSNEINQIIDPDLFERLVYHVLLAHRGRIDEFTFVCGGIYSLDAEMAHWIRFLGGCDVKELTFYFNYYNTRIDNLLNYCVQLRRLCLTCCWFSVDPENVPHLRTLVSLHLTRCRCNDEKLENVIDSLPNLEKLVLSNNKLKRLAICSPSLKYLYLEDDFKEVYLETCPLLTDASFKMTAKIEGNSNNLIQPPEWLCRMRRLVMSGFFLMFLAETYNWDGASINCPNLEVLELDTIHFNDSDEVKVAFSILRASSNLNILLINGLDTYDLYHIPVNARCQEMCRFNKLRFVRITILRTCFKPDVLRGDRLRGSEPEVKSFTEMIKILLAGSPVLENMHIHYIHLDVDEIWFMRELLSYERASPQLKLKYTATRGHFTN